MHRRAASLPAACRRRPLPATPAVLWRSSSGIRTLRRCACRCISLPPPLRELREHAAKVHAPSTSTLAVAASVDGARLPIPIPTQKQHLRLTSPPSLLPVRLAPGPLTFYRSCLLPRLAHHSSRSLSRSATLCGQANLTSLPVWVSHPFLVTVLSSLLLPVNNTLYRLST